MEEARDRPRLEEAFRRQLSEPRFDQAFAIRSLPSVALRSVSQSSVFTPVNRKHAAVMGKDVDYTHAPADLETQPIQRIGEAIQVDATVSNECLPLLDAVSGLWFYLRQPGTRGPASASWIRMKRVGY
jgi:hypothetical protein